MNALVALIHMLVDFVCVFHVAGEGTRVKVETKIHTHSKTDGPVGTDNWVRRATCRAAHTHCLASRARARAGYR